MSVQILHGDCREVLAGLPEQSVHCCVTSPPYFGLRDYGVDGQIGLEQTPAEFVDQLVLVFREVRRVMREDGTLWLNLGDSYARSGGTQAGGNRAMMHMEDAQLRCLKPPAGLKKHKDLIGIPWRVAFALQADGWYLRQDIIWSKPNPMPESVRDRCTKAHEYVFLLSKSGRYFFDQEAISEPVAPASVARLAQDVESQRGSERVPGKTNGPMKAAGKGNRKTFWGGGVYTQGRSFHNDTPVPNDSIGNAPNGAGTRNKRSVWNVATQPFSEAHFATMPPELAATCIKAGCPIGGTVLDPFGGAGTTGLVADRLQRDATLIELNPAYIEIAKGRITSDSPLFAEVA
jgi:DNA modification methylase